MDKKEKYINYIVNDMLENSHYHMANPSHIVMFYGTAINKYNINKSQVMEELSSQFGIHESDYTDIMKQYVRLLPEKNG